jgi:hypothetical protein
MEREVRRWEGLGQLGFDVYPPATVDESDPRQTGGEVFLDAEPRELFVGALAAGQSNPKPHSMDH